MIRVFADFPPMSSSRYPAPAAAAARDAADPRVVGLPEATVALLHQAARGIRDGDAATAQAILTRVVADTREHPEALRLFGLLQLRQRRAVEAVATLRRAAAQWPNDALLRSDLASALAASSDIDGALASWRKATELDPTAAMTWFNLGRQLQLRGDSAAAADALMRTTTLLPDFLPARVLLGDALVHLGRFDDATASYRAALAVMPSCGDAWRGLGNIKTRALDDADRMQMRALLDAADTADSDRIAIGFALGKAEEDAGRCADALSALAHANALQRRLAPWREALLRAEARLQRCLTRQLPMQHARLEALARTLVARQLPPPAIARRLSGCEHALTPAMRSRLLSAQHRLDRAAMALAHLNPENVLDRGYVLVYDRSGALVTDHSPRSIGEQLTLQSRRRRVRVTADEITDVKVNPSNG